MRSLLFSVICSVVLLTHPYGALGANEARLNRCIVEALISRLGEANTTTLRKETRYTVDVDDWKTVEEELKAHYQGAWTFRDESKLGRTNVTTTDYSEIIQLPPKFGNLSQSARLRIRSYGTRPEGTREPLVKEGTFVDYSKVELKIDHPTEEGVVYKPGLEMKNTDIAALFRDKDTFDRNVERIRAESKNLTRVDRHGNEYRVNDPDIVDQMLVVIGELQKARTRGENARFENWVQNVSNVQYERTAYQINLADIHGTKIPVQITVDKNIDYKKPYQDGGVLAAFEPDHRVIEVKVPLAFAKMSDKEVKTQVPELYFLRQQLSGLRSIASVEPGAGKRSTIMSKYFPESKSQALRRFLVEQGITAYANHIYWLPIIAAWIYFHDKHKTDHKNDIKEIRKAIEPLKKNLDKLNDELRHQAASKTTERSDQVWSAFGPKYTELGKQFKTLLTSKGDRVFEEDFSKLSGETNAQSIEAYNEAKNNLKEAQANLLAITRPKDGVESKAAQARVNQAQRYFSASLANRAIMEAFFGQSSQQAVSAQIQSDSQLVEDSRQFEAGLISAGTRTAERLDALAGEEKGGDK
jgi:hypothetical protein